MAIAGKVALTPKGAWSADVTYEKLDVVSYGGNGYVAFKETTGNLPTDTEFWMLLVESTGGGGSSFDPTYLEEAIGNIINGTTMVGSALVASNAETLANQEPSYYAKAEDLQKVIDGDTPVASAEVATTAINAEKADSVEWDNVQNKPTSYSASMISAGTLGGSVKANENYMANTSLAQVRDIVIVDTAPEEGATASYPNGTIVFSKA